MAKIPRPPRPKGYKQILKEQQGNRCWWCEKPLRDGDKNPIHHDYKDHTQAEIRNLIYSDEMTALGFSDKDKKRLYKSMYNDPNHNHVVHKDCHFWADREQDMAKQRKLEKRERAR